MPSEPIIFESKEEAIKLLSKYSARFEFPIIEYSEDELIKYSVGGSIFRAFSLSNQSGSIVYKNWAKQNLKKLLVDLKKAKSQKKFDELVLQYSHSLIDYWAKRVENKSEKIGFGPASKIVNLFIKVIQLSTNHRIKGIDHLLNVPFDLYTIRPLKNIINDLSDVNYNIKIPSTATMGYVVNEELYWVLTKAIRKLCKEAEIMPIVYEYWGWDRTHY